MHIGYVAKKIGLTPDAIRFYERNALLRRPPRSAGGFREFADADVEALRFIRRVQRLGFTLKEVRELLQLRQRRLQPCAPVRRRLEQKLRDVHMKLEDLHTLEHDLRAALRGCDERLRRHSARCPLLASAAALKPRNEK